MQIAFSGKLGSGKSTVCAILKEKYGYEIYSTGTIQRKIAEEMGISTLELNKRMSEDPALDHVIDDAVVELSRRRAGDNLIYDSRMAWHFAENTFKVYMYVDPTVAAKRVMLADRGSVEKYSSIDEAREMLIARSIEENKRFKDIYKVDNFDYFNYDLIIDSTSATPEQIAEAIVTEAGKYSESPFTQTKVMLSPYVLFPTKQYGTDDGENITVSVNNGVHYVISGHGKLAALQLGNASLVEATLTRDAVIADHGLYEEYEENGNFKYETKPID
ncbi:MAG: cytidylate kinase family protein [Clostridia bacterium]|nr:cytidylate kinase family protein [Clostridia bacterium]